MGHRWRTLLLLIAGLAALTALGLHAYLGHYSRMMADDFCSAGMARRLGVLRAVWYWYISWTGRYSASALDAVIGLMGPAVTSVVPAIALIVWLAVLFHAALPLFDSAGRSQAVYAGVLSTLCVFATLALSPSVPQSLYWGQGMRAILPPLILSTLHVDYLVRIRQSRLVAPRPLLLVPTFLSTLLIGGFNETYAALQVAAFGGASLITVSLAGQQARKELLQHLLAGTLGAAIALAIVAMSPGNPVRQAFFPPPPDPLKLLQIAWANFLAFLVHLAATPERALVIFGLLGISTYIGMRHGTPRPSWIGAVVPVLGLGLAFAGFVPAAYGFSDAPPDRTLLIPAHLIVLSAIYASLSLGSRIGGSAAFHSKAPTARDAVLIAAVLLLFSAAVMVDKNLWSNAAAYRRYAVHWEAVNAEIIQARERGESVIWIQPIPNWAGLNEPNDNPKFWVNTCMSEYYGIDVFGRDMQ